MSGRWALALLVLAPAVAVGQPAPRPVSSGPSRGTSDRFGRTSLDAASARAGAVGTSPAIAWPLEHEIPSLDAPAGSPESVRSATAGIHPRDDRAGLTGDARPPLDPPLASFPGLSPNAVVPPDPILAAGPEHVLVAVNSSWAIFTKSGARLFQTTASAWFLPQLPALRSGSLVPYDPQVAYDPVGARWILAYVVTDVVSQSWVLLSVSSSSDPTQPWFSWALRGDTNGDAPSGNFSDFPALGFDSRAIYLATSQINYASGGFDYAKVRVFPKDPLYAGSSSAAWSDLWDLQDPDFPGVRARSVRPAQTFGEPGAEYLLSNSSFAARTHVTLWTLAGGAGGAPALTSVNVAVAASAAPPGANQPGGSPGAAGCPTPCLLNTGSGSITSAVSRSGSLWFCHTVADATGLYSRARYARIDLSTRSAVEDEAIGSDGCWYFYPAIAVDARDSLVMVFGRTCGDEFAGIRYTARSASDASLAPSVLLQAGASSYVVPVGNGAPVNRWGDFFGAAVDPADATRVWLVGEHAASQRNTWATRVAEVSVAPAAGDCLSSPTALCLGDGRFRATAAWRRLDGSSGEGTAVRITSDTGYFWFFSPTNIEVVVKVLDACGVDGHHWVFAGGLTNVEVTLTVTDTQTGGVRTYKNPAGVSFAPIQDTAAFATCP